MKVKRKAVRVSITVPAKLKDLMDVRHDDFNWSAIATKAFEKALRQEPAIYTAHRSGDNSRS